MLSLPPLREPVAGKAAPLLIATGEALDKEFGSSQNVLVLREKFYHFTQGELDTETFLDKVYEIAAECEFPAEFRDEMIRDRIVFGIQNRATKDRLMSAEKIDLNSVLTTVRRLVNSNRRDSGEETSSVSVNAIRRKTSHHRNVSSELDCSFCGFEHSRDRQQCPASGKTCSQCGKKGHFRKMCKSRKVHQIGVESENDSSISDEDENYRIESSFAVRKTHSASFKSIKITLTSKFKGKHFPLEAQIDTGASCNILPLQLYKKLKVDNLVESLQESRVRLQMYNGDITPSLGTCSIMCHNGARRATLLFEVAAVAELPLISASASVKLGCIHLGEGVNFITRGRAQKTKPQSRNRLKTLFKKTSLNEEDYEYGLLEIRNIPQAEGVSRAQELFGRQTRTKLPSIPDRNRISDKEQFARNKKKLSRRKKYFDKRARHLKRLSRRNVVRIQPLEQTGRWTKGTCEAQVGPRSYNIKLRDGTILRSNRRHLIAARENEKQSSIPATMSTRLRGDSTRLPLHQKPNDLFCDHQS